MAATFPQATAAEMQPMVLYTSSTQNDAADWLPAGAADRLRALRVHIEERHSLTIPFADISEATTARIHAEQRLARLLAHQHDGGFQLSEEDGRVVEQRKLVEKLTNEAKRLNERNEVRTAACPSSWGRPSWRPRYPAPSAGLF